MKHAIFASEAVASKVEALLSRLRGYPRCVCAACGGVNVGGGHHVGHNVCFTEREHAIRKHPALSQWAHPMPDAIAALIKAKLADSVADGKLTAAQATTIAARIDARAELAEDWTPVAGKP